MPSHRSLRMAEAIREVVANAILFDVADPRVHSITVLRVELSSDLRNATAFVSIMGSESEQAVAMKGLRHAGGYLQARVANRLQTRFTPVLSFKFDTSVKKSVEMSRMIDEALAADRVGSDNPPLPPSSVVNDEGRDDDLDEVDIDDDDFDGELDDESLPKPPDRH